MLLPHTHLYIVPWSVDLLFSSESILMSTSSAGNIERDLDTAQRLVVRLGGWREQSKLLPLWESRANIWSRIDMHPMGSNVCLDDVLFSILKTSNADFISS